MIRPPFQPPRPERIEIAGPVGPIEAIVEIPQGGTLDRFGVVCHPHPLHGGTMTNKVVHTLARTFNELGMPTLRFNYRGVGASAGAYGEGVGEIEDTLAVIAHGRRLWPDASLSLAGFSFGGIVALRAAQTTSPSLMVTVAPAVTRLDVSGIVVPKCPWLIVQGDADELVPSQSVLEWADRLSPKPTVHLIPGAEHFFHGRLNDLRDVVMKFSNGSERV